MSGVGRACAVCPLTDRGGRALFLRFTGDMAAYWYPSYDYFWCDAIGIAYNNHYKGEGINIIGEGIVSPRANPWANKNKTWRIYKLLKKDF